MSATSAPRPPTGAAERDAGAKSSRPIAAYALGIAAGGALLSLVIVAARVRSEPPARCAAGMAALGPRCCGEGQRLEADRCAGRPARCATGLRVTDDGCVADARVVRVEGGTLRIGPGDWEAQGVITPREAAVAPFGLDAYEVTEERWAACEARGSCAPIPLRGEPGRAVSGVSLAEARVFCQTAGGDLPTSDQLAFAAASGTGRRYPWGDTGAVCRRAAWGLTHGPCGEGAVGPELAGSHPDGAATPGVFDLAGNVAEWTRPIADDATTTEVRGGSYADSAAAALRSWSGRPVAVTARSAEIGFRCVYP